MGAWKSSRERECKSCDLKNRRSTEKLEGVGTWMIWESEKANLIKFTTFEGLRKQERTESWKILEKERKGGRSCEGRNWEN